MPTTGEPEIALYAPVKALLEGQGYEVKGEVLSCDVVGVRGDEPPVVVELKRTFSLALVYQGVDRLAMTDAVYLAVGRGRSARPRFAGCAGGWASGSWWSRAGERTWWRIRCPTVRAATPGVSAGCSGSTSDGSAIRPAAGPPASRS